MRMTMLMLAVIVGATGCESDAATAEKLPYGMDIVVIRGCEYIKAQQYGGYVYTHLGNCTNHAPAVVTNTVVVTNCSEHILGGKSGYIMDNAKIPHDWVMGTNGYMVPPDSREAWPTNSNIRGGYYIGGGVPNGINVEADGER